MTGSNFYPLPDPPPRGRENIVCVGLSGGLDSTVLLDMLHRQGDHALTAVHVHHGLSPNADAWAAHAQASCDARGVPLSIERVTVDRHSPQGLEAAARAARYAVYAARPEAVVALAHHRDDQAETVLLQVVRGTGLKGAAAMPGLRPLTPRVMLWRPLLDTPRTELLAYARRYGLTWVEDESNAGVRHDRNYLRHVVAPVLDARFPNWHDALARFARHAAEADELLRALARLDGLPDDPEAPLPLDPRLDVPRRTNLVRTWLAQRGLPMPNEARLAEIVRQAFEARQDAKVEIAHAGARIVRHFGALHVTSPAMAGDDRGWTGERQVDLGALGTLQFEEREGEGIALARVAESGWRVGHRRGGERIRFAPEGCTHTLKKLLNERRVPWWWRRDLPLLFHGGTLVWVPGYHAVAAGYAAGAAETGLRPLWRLAGKPSLC